MAEPVAEEENIARINRAYTELQSSKYYMYSLVAATVIAGLLAVKALSLLLGISNSTGDSTTIDFLEVVLVAAIFFEIGFIAKVAQIDSFENIKHKQFSLDCLLGFVSLVCFLLDNLVRAVRVNSILELLWTLPYACRAFMAASTSYTAVKEADVAKPPSGASFAVPKISKGAVATAVLGRLTKF